MARLTQIVAQLRAMDAPTVDGIMRRELARAAAPLAPGVRAAILNTPSDGGVPYHQPPGMRLRIARCVETWASAYGTLVTAGVSVNSAKMPPGQYSLPLMLEGRKLWRHPVFGTRPGVVRAPHPFFDGATAWYGPASRRAMERAERIIAEAINPP